MSMPLVLLSGNAKSGKDTAAKVITDLLGGVTLALSEPMKRFLMRAFEMTEEQLWGNDQKEVEFKLPGVYQDRMVEAFEAAFAPGYLENYDEELQWGPALLAWGAQLPRVTTPRHLLQTLGTECIREIDPDLWINYGVWTAQELLHGEYGYSRTKGLIENPGEAHVAPRVVVITDGRFRNEMLGVKQIGGLCVRIRRQPMVQVKRSDVIKFKINQAPDWKKHASEIEQNEIPDWWFNWVIQNGGTLEEFTETVRRGAPMLFRPTVYALEARGLMQHTEPSPD